MNILVLIEAGRGEFLEYLDDYLRLKKDSAAWN
jgi:hypothetical protein